MILSNYLLDLPDDIQIYIYKYVFNNTLKDIKNNNIKSLYDFYDILIKSKLQLSYSIDNIYIGAVIKNFGKIPRPVGGEVGYRTYHYVK